MLGDSEETEGVLKVNSRILEAHELRKLDKSEKSLVNAIHTAGKGRGNVPVRFIGGHCYLII